MRYHVHMAAGLVALAMAAPSVLADSPDGPPSDEGPALETPGLSDDGLFALPDANLMINQPDEDDWLLMPPDDTGSDADWLLPETGGTAPTGEPLGESGN